MNQQLPKIKIRQDIEFNLLNLFNSKIDAQKELFKIRNENRCFGKRKRFIFSSKKENTMFSHGVYEQLITLPIFCKYE